MTFDFDLTTMVLGRRRLAKMGDAPAAADEINDIKCPTG